MQLVTGSLCFCFPSSASRPMEMCHHSLPFLGKWLPLLFRDSSCYLCVLLFVICPTHYLPLSNHCSQSLLATGSVDPSWQWGGSLDHINMSHCPHRAWPIVGCCWERRTGKKKGREERTWSLPWLMEYVIFCSRERGNLRDSPHNFQCEIVQPVLYVMKEEGKNNESHSRGSGTGAGH